MKRRKLLTLEQLVSFCSEQKFYSFSSKDSGYTLSVQVPGLAPAVSNYKSDDSRGLLYTDVKVCHTLLNRNGSYVSENNMKKAMPTLKYRPVLAKIHQLDSGEYDFHSHDMTIIENEDGEEEVIYEESQVGSFTVDEPYLEYDKQQDKTYVKATAVIPEEYTRAADIIRRKEGTKVSCELCIESFSYNAKENYLELEDFYFAAVTLLGSQKDGTEIGEGMLGSRLDIKDFSTENNSVLNTHAQNQEKLIELLDKLNTTLSNFNIDNQSKEGGTLVNHFEELLAKYNVTVEDITFEYENLTDEELDAKFAEAFEEEKPEEDTSEDTDDEVVESEVEVVEEHSEDETEEHVVEEEHEIKDQTDDETDPEEDVVVEEMAVRPSSYEIHMSDGTTKAFELSLDDIQSALYSLVNESYSEADNAWYSVTVYESHVIMYDWWSGKAYKQTYKRDEDNFSLTGDRVEVFQNWLTKDEEKEIAEMRSNYSAISEELSKYQKAEEKANKEVLLNSEDYKSIKDKAEFVELSKNYEQYSLAELTEKLDSMLLSYAKTGGLTFAAEMPKAKVVNKTGLPITTKKKNNRYGSIFSQQK